MVFLRPKIVRTDGDAEDLMNEIYDKAPRIKAATEEKPDKKSERD